MLIRLAELTMGRRQVVRQRFLVPSYAGSNPAAPANEKYLSLPRVFFICLVARVHNPRFGVRGAQSKSQLYLSFCRAPQEEGASRQPAAPAISSKLGFYTRFFFAFLGLFA